MRGREKVAAEWQIICLTHNLLKLFQGRCQEFCVNGVWIDALFFNAVFLAPQASGAVGKWESWFWISTFPWPTILLAVASVSPL
jgi:hypothetical protein